MPSRLLFIIFVLLIFAGLALFMFMSPSYQTSLQAKVYYYVGDYNKANKLAKQAYSVNSYNRMAATVMTQSGLALEYLDYIEQGNEYLAKIKTLSQSDVIEKADRVRIKFMSEIMIESYPKLTPTVLIDEELSTRVRHLYEEFVKIHETVTDVL